MKLSPLPQLCVHVNVCQETRKLAQSPCCQEASSVAPATSVGMLDLLKTFKNHYVSLVFIRDLSQLGLYVYIHYM